MQSEPVVIPVPCLKDNYAYLVFCADGNGECVVVDPSEAAPVRAEVKRRGLTLKAILNTHHHLDHVGGNLELRREGALPVYAHESDSARIPGFTRGLSSGDTFEEAGLSFSVLHVPGHTLGAIAYVTSQVCFTGDTLFCGGCGRLFEGTPAQMHNSLTKVIGRLDDSVQIYVGHEHTESNLTFAQKISGSAAIESRLYEVRAKRARGEFCASASLGLERSTNPFLRCGDPAMQSALGHEGDAEQTFAALRRLKDKA